LGDVEKLEETNRALSEERNTLASKLQSATDKYKSEKSLAQEEIKHLQRMLQEEQTHSQQQAEVINHLEFNRITLQILIHIPPVITATLQLLYKLVAT